MNYFPQPFARRRLSRFRLTEPTPAILEFADGGNTTGELLVISHKGGLLLLPQLVPQGSMLELMFQTHRGPVVGGVEMLAPVSSTQQPFRFLRLPEHNQHTLQVAFQSGVYRNIDEEERIEELRAAVAKWNPAPVRRYSAAKLIIGLLALAGCLAGAFYIHLLPH